MSQLTRVLVLSLISAVLFSSMAAQGASVTLGDLTPSQESSAAEEPVTFADLTPAVENSLPENEEVTEPPQETEPKHMTGAAPASSEQTISFLGGHRLQTNGMVSSAASNSDSSNSDSSNSENSESSNVEVMQGGPVLEMPTESMESKENEDPASEESFTSPAGK
ncbi:hypothetical protein XELAEV_18034103mg [Xenopus laevis]|uniref:Uncharacterized protein n=1 Tax=Xenopus laevis TaxID=8355 RepID=A0A974CKJ6_XENLA|nr:hypothetical protein XELAEV_18034103mg [Xenopus laevis]